MGIIGSVDPDEPEGDVPVDNPERARGRRLDDHDTVSGTTIHGWPSAAFGSIFVAAGAATAIIIAADGSVGGTTLLLSLVCGCIFIVGGLVLAVHGLAGVIRMSRLRREREKRPEEPWRWDHLWNETGARDDAVRRLVLWAYRALFFAAFMLPFNWLVFLSGALPWWGIAGFGLVTGLFDLLVAYVVYRFVMSLLQLLRYGVGAVRYSSFPFFLGETLDVSFLPTSRMSDLRGLRATLRCVEERYEVFDPDDTESSTTIVPYELYSDTRTISGGGTDVNLSFPLPEDGSPTRLGERPPVYWELEVEAEAPGADYEAAFLLPVYSRRPA